MNAYYDNFIGIYRDVIDKEICDQLINLFNDKKDFWNYERFVSNTTQISLQFQNHGSFKILSDIVFDAVKGAIDDYDSYYNVSQNLKKFEYKDSAKLQLSNESNTGITDWHYERSVIEGSVCYNRRLAYILYLNDVVESGKTEFKYINSSCIPDPESGLLLIFPADFTHTHRAPSNLKGNKYIITGWIE